MNTERLNRYGELALLWLLCTVCTSATVCIYMNTTFNLWSVLGAVISALVILFAEYAGKKKLGGLLYTAVLICVCFIPSFMINGMEEMFRFVRWFFSGSEAVETETGFILTLTLMMSFLFTSAAYYFTRIIYRSSVMILITLIPFALSVKTMASVPYSYAAIAAALNIILFIYHARKTVVDGAESRGKATMLVYADFTIAVILLALIIPKPSVTPYYEKFEEMSNNFQFGGTGESSYSGEYKDSSGTADELRRGESVLIYAVATADPVYMKTQVFDIYDNETHLWLEAEDMLGSKSWQETAPLLNYEKLGDAVEKLTYNPELAEAYDITEIESHASIYAQSFPAVYVLAPLRATGLSLYNVNAEYSARTAKGEIFTDNKLMPENAIYRISYYSEDVFDSLVANGLCDTDFEEYGLFLEQLYDKAASEAMDDEAAVIGEFLSQHNDAAEYSEKTLTVVSDEIRDLAEEITAGLEYDYQKAAAIEEYFHQNGFIYDLNYEAPEESDTPEYFLFESRTGICSDFAAAYTLLARAAGLTVRYVEGFVMQPSTDTAGMYLIYTDNAHAYPEVYVSGAGWTVYEPTPSTILSAGGQGNEAETQTDPLAYVFTAIIAVAVSGMFILIVALAPKALEMLFRIRVRLSDGNNAVIMLYNRHCANMERRFEKRCGALTPEQLAAYTEDITDISLEAVTKPFIKACYGGMKIDVDEKNNAFDCYKAQYKAIKKTKKRKD